VENNKYLIEDYCNDIKNYRNESTKTEENIIVIQQTETSDKVKYNKVDSYSKVIGHVKKQD